MFVLDCDQSGDFSLVNANGEYACSLVVAAIVFGEIGGSCVIALSGVGRCVVMLMGVVVGVAVVSWRFWNVQRS